MAQRLEQAQEAVQTQQLTSLQVAVAKLVELPITQLATRVQDEMLDNAALEEKDGDDHLEESPDDLHDDNRDTDEQHEEDESDPEDAEQREADAENSYEETEDYGSQADAMGDYFSSDDVPDYLKQRAEAERDRTEIQLSGHASFYDELESQIGEHDLNDHEREIVEYLIGSLDDDGFLRKDLDALVDELVIYHGISTTREEVERLLGVLQTFEPRGIGARSLQECLRIQLEDPDRHTPYTDAALTVIDCYYKEFTGRRWDLIKQHLKLSDEDINHVRHELTHLNPMPGRSLGETSVMAAPTVVPDFFVTVTPDGDVQVSLNQGDVPELRVSPAFRDSLKQYGGNKAKLTREQHDAYLYAKQKVDSALSFINLLSRRRMTLLSVMRAIVEFQHDFFVNDDDEEMLRPLTLKEVAAKAGVDISTVSRVTSTKYVQTTYGTYPLKFFFSLQFTTVDGDELSTRKVKAALRELLDNEDKRHPMADLTMAQILKERGFNVARRTVAKYRDAMGIPTARLRKETITPKQPPKQP